MGTIAAESGGNPNALHPLVKKGQYAGQRAIGLFGIMPGNVPAWSREHLGRTLTPEELARDTEAQRAIFRGEMQKNIAKHGSPQDAASIWFTGRPYAQAAQSGANDGFTNVQNYVAKVTGSAPRMSGATPATAPAQTGETMRPLPPPPGMLGGLGGLGGGPGLGDTLQAIGMSLLSSPAHSPFQSLPEAMQIAAKNRAAQALQQYNIQKDERDFGLRERDLEARRAEQAIDNARQERALAITEKNAATAGKTEMQKVMELNFPDLQPGTEEYLRKYYEIKSKGGDPETYGVTPEYVTRDGKTVAVRYGNRGGKREDVVEGTLNKGIDKIDAGTHWIIRDRASGTETTQPKNVGEVRSQEVQGKLSGEAIANAPKNITRITAALDLLDQIQKDPIRESATGLGHLVPGIIPNKISDFHAKVEQARSGAFTEGLEALRGFGPVTEREGEAAKNAVTRMKTAMTDEAFNEALNDYKKHLNAGLAKAQALLQGRSDPAPVTPRPGGAPGIGPGGGTTRRGTTFRVID
jgi:hypothetical protein